METSVQLAGVLCIVFRAQGMSEKLKTGRSLFSMNVGRGHIVESFTVEEVCVVLARVLPSVIRFASHRALKFSHAAQHMAIVARIRTDWLR